MKVYLDQNAWHYAISSLTAGEFKQKLAGKGVDICLGLHNIYEFGRCFLDESDCKKIQTGKEVFQYLQNLDISSFLKPTDELIESDLVYAHTGGRLTFFLDQLNIIATKGEIYRLSQGWSNKAKKFVKKREAELERDAPKYKELVAIKNRGVKWPRDFCEFRDNSVYRRTILLRSHYKEEVRTISNAKLFDEPYKYPFVNTFINAQLYLNFVAGTTPDGPSKKSTSDYRHLIDANVADIFVTEDRRIQGNSKILCPWLDIYSWEQFALKIEN